MAASFKDVSGHAWNISINVTSLKALREFLDVDLAALVNSGEVVEKFLSDPVLLIDVIFVLCKDAAQSEGVNSEDFGRRIGNGEILDAATEALFEAIANFFTRRGAAMWKASRKLRQLETQALKQAEIDLEAVNLMDLISGTPSTSAPESSE